MKHKPALFCYLIEILSNEFSVRDRLEHHKVNLSFSRNHFTFILRDLHLLRRAHREYGVRRTC
jgi:hypothetical protein